MFTNQIKSSVSGKVGVKWINEPSDKPSGKTLSNLMEGLKKEGDPDKRRTIIQEAINKDTAIMDSALMNLRNSGEPEMIDLANKWQAEYEAVKINYLQSTAITKGVIESQMAVLNISHEFGEKSVNFGGLITLIKTATGKTRKIPNSINAVENANETSKEALDRIITEYQRDVDDINRTGPDEVGPTSKIAKDTALLEKLQKDGYLRYTGKIASLETGTGVIKALQEIQKNWTKYEAHIKNTDTLKVADFQVPDASDFPNWKDKSKSVANFLADIGGGDNGNGDGILSATNHVARLGFLGIFGREDLNKKQLSELALAQILQGVLADPTKAAAFYNALGVTAPEDIGDFEKVRRAIFVRVALSEGNPDAIRDPALANSVAVRGIKEQTRASEAKYKEQFTKIETALKVKNQSLPPELIQSQAASLTKFVTTAGILVGTGISMDQLLQNVKFDAENPKAFSLISVGGKWEKQLTDKLQGHLGIGGGIGLDTNGGVSAGIGGDIGIKYIIEDNGKISVEKGNKTLGVSAGLGYSLLGFVPAYNVEVTYRWNDVLSSLMSADYKVRKFLNGLFKTDEKNNITMVDRKTKTADIDALTGGDPLAKQDIEIALNTIESYLRNTDLKPNEKITAVQNAIENFARYEEIMNAQKKQGAHLAGIGFGLLAGPGLLIPTLGLKIQNIQAGYRVDADATRKLAETKSEIVLDPKLLEKQDSIDSVVLNQLKELGINTSSDGMKLTFDDRKTPNFKNLSNDISIGRNEVQATDTKKRLMVIVHTARDLSGIPTTTVLLTTVPAKKENITVSRQLIGIENSFNISANEKANIQKLVDLKELPDKLPKDKQSLRTKYPEMENSNDKNADGKYTMNLTGLQTTLSKMSKDPKLTAALKGAIDLSEVATSTNESYLRMVLGTLIALTSGSPKSRELGLKLKNGDATADQINTYIKTPGLMAAEAEALNHEYGTTFTAEEIQNYMLINDGIIDWSKLPKNTYAENAYAKYKQIGTAISPLEAGTIGGLISVDQSNTNIQKIRENFILKQELPQEMQKISMTKDQYHALLRDGSVNVNGTEYKAKKTEVSLSRSSISFGRTCFNCQPVITLPDTITSEKKTITVIGAAAAGLNTAPVLKEYMTGNEVSIGIAGPNQKRDKQEPEEPKEGDGGSTKPKDDGDIKNPDKPPVNPNPDKPPVNPNPDKPPVNPNPDKPVVSTVVGSEISIAPAGRDSLPTNPTSVGREGGSGTGETRPAVGGGSATQQITMDGRD